MTRASRACLLEIGFSRKSGGFGGDISQRASNEDGHLAARDVLFGAVLQRCGVAAGGHALMIKRIDEWLHELFARDRHIGEVMGLHWPSILGGVQAGGSRECDDE